MRSYCVAYRDGGLAALERFSPHPHSTALDAQAATFVSTSASDRCFPSGCIILEQEIFVNQTYHGNKIGILGYNEEKTHKIGGVYGS